MVAGILGKKQGMTRLVNEAGAMVPVTVVKVEENQVLNIKTEEKDGKNAIIVGIDPYKKERKNKKFKTIKEFQVADTSQYEIGKSISLDLLKEVEELTVSAVSKGKGFQGVMKRYNFHGGPASHGSHFHREPGSIGGCDSPGKVIKGKKLPGHMGCDRVTLKNRPVEGIDEKEQTIMIKGAIPGARNTIIEMRF